MWASLCISAWGSSWWFVPPCKWHQQCGWFCLWYTETPHSTATNTAWAYHDPILDYVVITFAQVIDMDQRKAESLTLLWTIWMNESASTWLDVMGPISHFFFLLALHQFLFTNAPLTIDGNSGWLYENLLTELDLILQNDISLID